MDDINLELQRQINDLKRQQNDQRAWEFPYLPATVAFANFFALPGLRGYWPFSSINESANCIDLSGQGRTLTGSGTRSFGVMTNGGCYATFNGSNTFYYRADEAGLDVTSSLTLLGWFYAAASTTQVAISKAATGQTSYQLYTSSSNRFTFLVSSDGTATTTVGAASDYTANTWYFLAARYTASTELALFWYSALSSSDGGKATNTTSIPAALHSGTAQFRIGANESGNYLNGRGAYAALLTYPISDKLIMALYEGSRRLFAA